MNSFCECMRKIRGEESLRTMAKRLGVSPSFLSAMEVGKKTIPTEYAYKIAEEYKLDKKAKDELIDAIAETNEHVDIEISNMNEETKKMTLLFARKVKEDDREIIEKLRKALLE